MEEKYGLKCSWCGSEKIIRVDEEVVRCLECSHRTDWYEAYKAGGRKRG